MVDIDPITGLPKELGVWEDIAKENQKVVVKLITKKYGKKHTVIEGIDSKNFNIKELLKKLKSKFACGGTSKDGSIELQGNYLSKARSVLVELGFPNESIEVKK
ncbi:MAG: stress response translation initiation inhibitor YciH [Nanobdellota archaeon]